MKNTIVIFVTCLLLVSLWGCKIGEDDTQPQRNIYTFTQGVDFDPFKQEYGVGDIVWMEVNIPDKTLVDEATMQDIVISNASFLIQLTIAVVPVDPEPQSDERFSVAVDQGAITKGTDFETTGQASLRFGCPDSDYFMRIGLQFREAGNYLIFLNKEQISSLIFFTDSGDCAIQDVFPPIPEADLGYVTFPFAVADNNLDIFNELVDGESSPLLDEYRAALEEKTAFFLKVR